MTMKSGSDAIATVQKTRPASRGTRTQKTTRVGKTTSAARRSTSTQASSGSGELGMLRTARPDVVRDAPLAASGRDTLMATGDVVEDTTRDPLMHLMPPRVEGIGLNGTHLFA